MTAGKPKGRVGLSTRLGLATATTLLLLSGAAYAGREDTIEANRELLRQRLGQMRAVLPARQPKGHAIG